MSDQFYAVQYRNMHTAIHHVAIFSLEQKAQEFHMYIEENVEQPPESFFEPLNFIVDYEIDHRDPPTHCIEAFDELLLIYVNDSIIPDVF